MKMVLLVVLLAFDDVSIIEKIAPQKLTMYGDGYTETETDHGRKSPDQAQLLHGFIMLIPEAHAEERDRRGEGR